MSPLALDRAAQVITALKAAGLRLALAESCTGGLLSATLTSVSGSSAVFQGAIVTYSNEAKEDLLAVPKALMIAEGSVSGPVALQMAQQAAKRLRADIAIGVTGVAGPNGGTPAKPVGRVYLAVAASDKSAQYEFDFQGDRAAVQLQTVEAALDGVLRLLDAPSLP